MTSYKGKFRPKNPQKYEGDSSNIVYRSLLERTMMVYFDKHPHVLKWSSEELIVPYISPLDNRVHRYFPDFVITMINSKGEEERVIIEIKPDAQTKEPKLRETKSGKKTRRYVKEVSTYLVNCAKWKAAEEFCKKNDMSFKILTEHTIRPYNNGESIYKSRKKTK